MIRTALQWGSPGGARGRLTVLIFHRVLPAPDPLFQGEMHAARFDALCGWLAGWTRVLPLHDAVRRLREGCLPSRALAITFDDGYADNASVAMPLLRKHGLCATFFVSTGYLDGGRMWNDTVTHAVRHTQRATVEGAELGLPGVPRLSFDGWDARRAAAGQLLRATKYLGDAAREAAVRAVAERLGVSAFPDDLMMSSAQVRSLRDGGMQIGAHTVSHPILAQLPRPQALHEVRASRVALEGLLDQAVTVFAYPNGKPHQDYSAESVAVVREAGFETAVTTEWGSAGPDVDPWQVPRFSPWDTSRWRYGWRLVRNLRVQAQGVGA